MTARRTLLLWAGLLYGCAPANIARSSCQSEMLSTADPWTCTITGERVGRPSWIEFDTESRNQVAQVQLALGAPRDGALLHALDPALIRWRR